MSNTAGETTVPVSEWTTGTLKIYHDAIIGYERQISNERDLRYQQRFEAQEAATKNLKEYTNEYRGALNDLSSNMATKVEVTTAVASLTEKIDTQSNLIGELRSRLDTGNPAIQSQLDTSSGRSIGIEKTIAYVVTAISIAFGVVGMILAFNNQEYNKHMSYKSFAQKYTGKRVDPDGVYNYQCVDLILQWLREEQKITSGVWGNAIDYWTKPTPTLLKKYSKVAGSKAKQGDIVVFKGLPSNPYGHIGIATGKTTSSMVEVLEQNGATGDGSGKGGNAIRTRSIARNRVAGLLRRKGIVPKPKPKTYTVVSGDTLGGIARRNKKTVAQLVSWNKARYPSLVKNPNFIQVGWKLRVR